MTNFPEFTLPDFSDAINAMSAIQAKPLPVAYSYSDTQVEIIKDYIIEFQNSLDKDHDVALLLTHFGSSILMEVTHIGYEESVLVVFKGYVDGRPSTLIQHVSQLNFLLTSVPKNPDAPKRKIGFTLPDD